MYLHQSKDWPNFTLETEKIVPILLRIRHQQGRLIGRMDSIGFSFQQDAVIETVTQDVIKSSEIEGEILDYSLVRSSVARHLGVNTAAMNHIDRNVEGVVEMMLDATQNFDQPLTKERLFSWHRMLFPLGRSGFAKIKIGSWREGPVQVISGRPGKEIVHFEGPTASLVDREMEKFIDWINHENKMDLVLKSAIAHLWFVTIHPFDDGNGRIGRAIADYLLARSEKSALRFYSLSSQIQAERQDYYQILEQTQKESLDITHWIQWYLFSLERAIQKAGTTFDTVRYKEKVWQSLSAISLNERQKKLINRLLDGFVGKLTTSKWAKIAKCSQDTAHRDIKELIAHGVLIKNEEGGRNTSYSLKKTS